jgi:uncharacterized protein YkwD
VTGAPEGAYACRVKWRSARAPWLLLAVAGSAEPRFAHATSATTEREPAVTWAPFTASPRSVVLEGQADTRDRLAELLARCGRSEAGLTEVAQRVVASRIAGRRHLDLAALTFSLRAAGEPHVWPHAWVITGRGLDRHETAAKLEAWGVSFHDVGGEGSERRCGVATGVARDGTEVTAAVALDALADLAPLPTTAHIGMWLTVDATLLVPSGEAHVLVQGAESDPRPVPTWIERDGARVHVRARFSPDRPGPLTVQVVADVATGPRPVLEARVFADATPTARFDPPTAPGEDAPTSGATESGTDRLLAMVSALREAEGLPPLARDRSLDAAALAHARAMQSTRTVGHDVGDGDPEGRVEATGARPRLVGENVAHAASVRLAHRALYESPSHRENLLRAEFNRVGAAVLDDADGSVWVAEVFAAGLH